MPGLDPGRESGIHRVYVKAYVHRVHPLAEKRSDGTMAIQIKDYDDRTTTATIYP